MAIINTAAYARESPVVQRMAVSALNYPRSMHWMRTLFNVQGRLDNALRVEFKMRIIYNKFDIEL